MAVLAITLPRHNYHSSDVAIQPIFMKCRNLISLYLLLPFTIYNKVGLNISETYI